MGKLYLVQNNGQLGNLSCQGVGLGTVVQPVDNTYYPQLDLGNDPTSTFGGRIKYVTPTGAGLKNGSSWENAYDNIQSAINSLSESSTTLSAVYVEEGKYMTTASISMKQGVSLYGGFLNDDKAWSARRPFTHRSIIDVNFSDKYLYSSATFISGQVIDGMTVINKNMGNASAFYSTRKWFLKHCVAENCYSSYRGGGFYLYTTGAVATNCIAIACSSRDYGGGFFLTTGTHAENCVALSCRATSCGGGFYATSSGFLDKCKAILCASRFGGGIQSDSQTTSITGCLALSCSSYRGAGFYSVGNTTDCLAIDCQTAGNGGGFYVGNKTTSNCVALGCYGANGGGFYITAASMENCYCSNCHASTLGGGICMGGASSVINCSVMNCSRSISSSSYGAGIYMVNLATVLLTNCAVYNSSPEDIYSVGALPILKNCAYATIGGVAVTSNTDPVILSSNPFTNGGTAPLNIVGSYTQSLAQEQTDIDSINNFIEMFALSSADLHPNISSPLLGAGYYESGVTPTTDADGVTRANPPTIGAYETTGV